MQLFLEITMKHIAIICIVLFANNFVKNVSSQQADSHITRTLREAPVPKEEQLDDATVPPLVPVKGPGLEYDTDNPQGVVHTREALNSMKPGPGVQVRQAMPTPLEDSEPELRRRRRQVMSGDPQEKNHELHRASRKKRAHRGGGERLSDTEPHQIEDSGGFKDTVGETGSNEDMESMIGAAEEELRRVRRYSRKRYWTRRKGQGRGQGWGRGRRDAHTHANRSDSLENYNDSISGIRGEVQTEFHNKGDGSAERGTELFNDVNDSKESRKLLSREKRRFRGRSRGRNGGRGYHRGGRRRNHHRVYHRGWRRRGKRSVMTMQDEETNLEPLGRPHNIIKRRHHYRPRGGNYYYGAYYKRRGKRDLGLVVRLNKVKSTRMNSFNDETRLVSPHKIVKRRLRYRHRPKRGHHRRYYYYRRGKREIDGASMNWKSTNSGTIDTKNGLRRVVRQSPRSKIVLPFADAGLNVEEDAEDSDDLEDIGDDEEIERVEGSGSEEEEDEEDDEDETEEEEHTLSAAENWNLKRMDGKLQGVKDGSKARVTGRATDENVALAEKLAAAKEELSKSRKKNELESKAMTSDAEIKDVMSVAPVDQGRESKSGETGDDSNDWYKSEVGRIKEEKAALRARAAEIRRRLHGSTEEAPYAGNPPEEDFEDEEPTLSRRETKFGQRRLTSLKNYRKVLKDDEAEDHIFHDYDEAEEGRGEFDEPIEYDSDIDYYDAAIADDDEDLSDMVARVESKVDDVRDLIISTMPGEPINLRSRRSVIELMAPDFKSGEHRGFRKKSDGKEYSMSKNASKIVSTDNTTVEIKIKEANWTETDLNSSSVDLSTIERYNDTNRETTENMSDGYSKKKTLYKRSDEVVVHLRQTPEEEEEEENMDDTVREENGSSSNHIADRNGQKDSLFVEHTLLNISTLHNKLYNVLTDSQRARKRKKWRSKIRNTPHGLASLPLKSSGRFEKKSHNNLTEILASFSKFDKALEANERSFPDWFKGVSKINNASPSRAQHSSSDVRLNSNVQIPRKVGDGDAIFGDRKLLTEISRKVPVGVVSHELPQEARINEAINAMTADTIRRLRQILHYLESVGGGKKRSKGKIATLSDNEHTLYGHSPLHILPKRQRKNFETMAELDKHLKNVNHKLIGAMAFYDSALRKMPPIKQRVLPYKTKSVWGEIPPVATVLQKVHFDQTVPRYPLFRIGLLSPGNDPERSKDKISRIASLENALPKLFHEMAWLRKEAQRIKQAIYSDDTAFNDQMVEMPKLKSTWYPWASKGNSLMNDPLCIAMRSYHRTRRLHGNISGCYRYLLSGDRDSPKWKRCHYSLRQVRAFCGGGNLRLRRDEGIDWVKWLTINKAGEKRDKKSRTEGNEDKEEDDKKEDVMEPVTDEEIELENKFENLLQNFPVSEAEFVLNNDLRHKDIKDDIASDISKAVLAETDEKSSSEPFVDTGGLVDVSSHRIRRRRYVHDTRQQHNMQQDFSASYDEKTLPTSKNLKLYQNSELSNLISDIGTKSRKTKSTLKDHDPKNSIRQPSDQIFKYNSEIHNLENNNDYTRSKPLELPEKNQRESHGKVFKLLDAKPPYHQRRKKRATQQQEQRYDDDVGFDDSVVNMDDDEDMEYVDEDVEANEGEDAEEEGEDNEEDNENDVMREGNTEKEDVIEVKDSGKKVEPVQEFVYVEEDSNSGRQDAVLSWSEWSACSVTCGAGIRFRTAICELDGEPCKGRQASEEAQACVDRPSC